MGKTLSEPVDKASGTAEFDNSKRSVDNLRILGIGLTWLVKNARSFPKGHLCGLCKSRIGSSKG
jgi:hypothetical protein